MVRGVSQPGRTGWPYSPTVSFLSRIQISAQVSEGDCQKEKRGVGGSPGSCAPGQWEGGAGQSAASQDARKCCGVRPIPQPACPSPSLSPPLTSPRLTSPPSAIPSFLGTPPPGIAFFVVVLELASHWRRRGAANAGEEGGLGAQPAAHRRDPAGQSGGRTVGRAICSPELTLQTPVECVRAREGWGSTSRVRGPVTAGLPLAGGPWTQIWVSFRLRNC